MIKEIYFPTLHAQEKSSSTRVTIPVGPVIAVQQPVRVTFQAHLTCPVSIFPHGGAGRIAIWIHLF